MIKSFVFVGLSLVTLGVSACGNSANLSGDDSSSAGETPPSQGTANGSYSMVIDAGQPLPPCDANSEKHLVYVIAETSFKVCQGGTWTAIDIKGPQGAAGAAGAAGKDGANGENGKDGTDSRIIASILCTGGLEDTTLGFSYSVALMKSGDVFVSGSIRDVVSEIGATKFFSAQQNGATNAEIFFTNDFATPANGGYWSLKLDRQSLVTTITYFDVDVSGGGAVWTMAASACVANKYE